MRQSMICFLAFLFFAVTEGFGQLQTLNLNLEPQDDQSYKLYRDGYNLILQANWKGALKKFDEVIRVYPKSPYREDASYWYAYSLKYHDGKKAHDALRNFIKEFPKSSYRSDALEDLAELQTRVMKNLIVQYDSLSRGKLRVGTPSIQIEIPDIQVSEYWGPDFPFGEQVAVMVFSEEMRDEVEWGLGTATRPTGEKDIDDNTRLKILALRGIATERDLESYQTVRDILLDQSEHPRLREEALKLFTRYQKFEVLPTLKVIATKDPTWRLRRGAIYYIGKYARDREAAAGTLIELYTITPSDSTSLRNRLLSSIARTKTTSGTDFLVEIVKGNDDLKTRESALYWLGRYGEGKKKKALYEILKEK